MCENILRISLGVGSLEFSSDGLKCSTLTPSVSIKEGNEEKLTILDFSITPLIEHYNINTYYGPAKETTFIWKDRRGYSFSWSVAVLEKLNGFVLHGSFYNGTSEAVRLSEIILGKTGHNGLVCDGKPSDWLLSTLSHDTRIGNMEDVLLSINEETKKMWDGWGLPIPFEMPKGEKFTDGKWRIYKEFLTLYADSGTKGIAIGPVGNPEADLRYECKVNNESMSLGIISEMNDVTVDVGQSRSSQGVLIIAEPNEFALKTIFNWISYTHGHRTHRGPVVGWCSWYDLGQNITEDSILNTIEAFVSIKDQVKVDVIQIDDGFQKTIGDWEPNERFSNGFGKIIDRIKAANAIPGIWLAPLAVHESTGIIDTHPDWFQRDAKGELLGECNNWGAKGRWLDPTHPEVQEFLRQIIKVNKAHGFEYFKIDFNTIDSGCRLHNPYKTRLQAYRDLYKLYREEMGEGSYLLSCSGFTRGTIGYADASRIGPDSCHIWSAAHPCTILESIRATGMNAIANGIFFANDPDVSYLRTRGTFDPIAGNLIDNNGSDSLTIDELRTWHGFVGLLGGLALISDPVHKLEFAKNIRMLEILNPPAPEKAISLNPGADKEHTQFGFIYNRSWGSSASVMIWNPEEKAANAKINLQALKCLGKEFYVWSFWDEKYLGIGKEAIESQSIISHGNLTLKFTAPALDRNEILLIGSNLHISMGAAEIKSFEATDKIVNIVLNESGARDGSIYLYSIHPLSLAKSDSCIVDAVEEVDEKVWKVALRNRARNRSQRISLICGK